MNSQALGRGLVSAVAVSLLVACSAGEESPYEGLRLGEAVLAVQVSAEPGSFAWNEHGEPDEQPGRIVLVAADGTARDVPASPVAGGQPVWTPEALYVAGAEMLYRISSEETTLTRAGVGADLIAGVPSGVGDTVLWASRSVDANGPLTFASSQEAQGASSGRSVGRVVHALATCDDGVYGIAGGLTDAFADDIPDADLAAAAATEALVSFRVSEWDGSEQRGTSAPDDAAIGTHTVAPCVDGVVHRLVYTRADRERVTGDDAALVVRSWDSRAGSRVEVAVHGGGVEALAAGDAPVAVQADAGSVVDGTMHWYDAAGGRLWATDLADGASRVVADTGHPATDVEDVRVVFGATTALVLVVPGDGGGVASLLRVDLTTGTIGSEIVVDSLTRESLGDAPVTGIAVRPDLVR